MSGGIYKNWRIVAAAVFSVVIIIGAYVLARGVESPQVAQASTEGEILKAIATKDADGDGLPDWEEALYGTDAHAVDTFHLGMTDGEAVARGLLVPKAIADVEAPSSASGGIVDPSLPPAPADGTLTAAFAKTFFTLYAAAKEKNGTGDLSADEVSAIVNQAINSLASSIKPAPDFKSAKDLTVAGSGPEALKAFAVSAEAVLFKNTTTATTSEINYFKYALVGNDRSAYAQMLSIAKAYRDSAAGIAALSVPLEMAGADLALVNSLMHLSQVITDLTRADSDTIAAILALQQYPKYTTALGASFSDIGDIYAKAGIVLPAGAPGAELVNMKANVIKMDTGPAQAPGK